MTVSNFNGYTTPNYSYYFLVYLPITLSLLFCYYYFKLLLVYVEKKNFKNSLTRCRRPTRRVKCSWETKLLLSLKPERLDKLRSP